jgi:hypothetical protein
VFFPAPNTIAVARSDAFPDALAAAGYLATHPGPLLLTPSNGSAAPATLTYLREHRSSELTLLVLGGDRAITPTTLADLLAAADR